MTSQDNLKKYSIIELLTELRAPKFDDTNMDLKNADSKIIVKELRDQQKVIYGTDDRVDLFQINDPIILGRADGVVALFDQGDIIDNGNST